MYSSIDEKAAFGFFQSREYVKHPRNEEMPKHLTLILV